MNKRDALNRRRLITAGTKVIPVLAALGLAVTVSEPARAGCFGSCHAECADNCVESCKGDCMGDCKGSCGGCDATCTGTSKS